MKQLINNQESNINNKEKKPGPAGFNGGTTVSISLVPEGFMAKVHFAKDREKKRKYSGKNKVFVTDLKQMLTKPFAAKPHAQTGV